MRSTSLLPLAAVLLLAACVGCRQTDVRTIKVRTPAVRNEACAQRVRAELGKLRGIDMSKVSFDFATGVTVVTYDSMILGRKNVEMGINQAGFDANELPANPQAQAALPPECRPSGAP